VAIGVELVEHEGVQPDTAELEPVQDPHRRRVRHQEAAAAGRLAPRPSRAAERRPAVLLPPRQRHVGVPRRAVDPQGPERERHRVRVPHRSPAGPTPCRRAGYRQGPPPMSSQWTDRVASVRLANT
jgi:hypothetical protein